MLHRLCTSSAVLVTESNPMYEKKTIADPANIPFIPKGKYLKTIKTKYNKLNDNRMYKYKTT